MPIRIDGTNTTANPGITGGDADTGLQFGTDEISFVTGGTNRATVESNGNFTIESGNLVLASGSGIDFSADGNNAGMSSELLDDYEEGTFTPSVSTAGYTLSLARGHYTKIGRFVQVNYRLEFSAVGASNSNVTVTNYPFANASDNHISGIVREASTTGALYALQINLGATQGGMNSMDGVSNGSNRTIRTGETYECSITYFTS